LNDDGLVLWRWEAEFLNKFPFELTGEGIKQRSKSLPDGGLMADIELPALI
jgi:hypothetical protein